MTEPRRRLEPLRLDPRPKEAPPRAKKRELDRTAQREAVRSENPSPIESSGSSRSSVTIVVAIVAGGLVVFGTAVTGAFFLLRRGSSPSANATPTAWRSPSPSLATPVLVNDGTDANLPVLPEVDKHFVDARGGWGWSDKCWINLKAGKWGWAKAECDMAMAMNPASPQPRASLLYNEGLVATAAGKIDEARRDFTSSLALREHPEVRAALNSLPR